MSVLASSVTVLYARRLALANTELAGHVAVAWRTLFDQAAAADTLAAIGVQVGARVTIGQAGAVAETLAYLRGLTAQQTGAALADIAPFTVPPGLIGTGASGAPVSALTGLAPSIYDRRIAEGWPRVEAAGSARSWLDALAASEPYRAANVTALTNAEQDDRLTGRVNRLPEPDACAFCALIADRGYTPAHAGFAAHAFCRCLAEPEVTRWVPRVPRQRTGLAWHHDTPATAATAAAAVTPATG